MASKDESLVDELLYGIESIAEIVGILYSRHITAYTTLALCKGRTTETKFVE